MNLQKSPLPTGYNPTPTLAMSSFHGTLRSEVFRTVPELFPSENTSEQTCSPFSSEHFGDSSPQPSPPCRTCLVKRPIEWCASRRNGVRYCSIRSRRISHLRWPHMPQRQVCRGQRRRLAICAHCALADECCLLPTTSQRLSLALVQKVASSWACVRNSEPRSACTLPRQAHSCKELLDA